MKKKGFFSFKKLICTTAIVLPVLCSVQSAYAISLEEALIHAYNFNPSLKAERAAHEATNEQLPQAYSGFLPTVSASYSKEKDKEKLVARPTSTTHPTSKSISITQPVFDGFDSWYQIKQAKNNILVADSQLRKVEQAILTDAVIAYIDVVRTHEIVNLSRNNENVLSEQLKATKDRFELGETTRTDVSQSEARLSRAQSDRIKAEGDYIQAKAEYKRVFGIEADDTMAMPSNLPRIPNNFEDVLARTLANNPDVYLAKYKKESLKNSVRRAKSSLLPSVSIVGSMSRQTGLSSTRVSTDIDNDTVALNVSIPLYQAGAEYSAIRQAKNNERSAQYLYSEARDQAISKATTAWQQVVTTRANTRANISNVKSAKLALEGVRQEQEVGARTTLDVLDAEQELFIAQLNLVTAVRNSVLAVYNVKSAMGELTAGSLELDVALYNPNKHLNDIKYKFIGF